MLRKLSDPDQGEGGGGGKKYGFCLDGACDCLPVVAAADTLVAGTGAIHTSSFPTEIGAGLNRGITTARGETRGGERESEEELMGRVFGYVPLRLP